MTSSSSTPDDLSKLTIAFVLDPPHLTSDSIILVASIRHFLGNSVRIAAYTPEHKEEFLFPYIREFYNHMDADIRLMDAEDKFVRPYKQGNKMIACAQPRDTEYTLFLDTDTAIVAPFALADLVSPGKVTVVPEGVQGWGGNDGEWEYVYGKYDLPLPTQTVRLSRSGKQTLPYFNAGMIAFPTGSDFAETWLRTAHELDDDPEVRHKRPWLDQIALPLAINLSGLQADIRDADWNLSISHPGVERKKPAFFERINGTDAKIVHFHRARYFDQTKFAGPVGEALAARTVYADLFEYIRPGMERAERRKHVWQRFGELKGKKDRSEAETQELKEMDREKKRFKRRRHDVDLHREEAPESILAPELRKTSE